MKSDFVQAQQLRQESRRNALLKDLGILAFLLCVFGVVVMAVFSPDRMAVLHLVMFAITCAATLLAAYDFRYLSMAAAGAQVLVYTVYVIFQHRNTGLEITVGNYVWLFLPMLTVGAMLLFQSQTYKITRNNETLQHQMEDLVLIHPLTGLYNLRALYIDLERQIAYAKRNKLQITLLWVELRYVQELRQILSDSQFEQLQQALAQCAEDAVRIEDRVYSTNDDGALAVILTCDEQGAQIVRGRIRSRVQQADLFEQITTQTLRIDLRTAVLGYDAEKISSASEFIQKTENELQYDV